jgi:hypothetical protein
MTFLMCDSRPFLSSPAKKRQVLCQQCRQKEFCKEVLDGKNIRKLPRQWRDLAPESEAAIIVKPAAMGLPLGARLRAMPPPRGRVTSTTAPAATAPTFTQAPCNPGNRIGAAAMSAWLAKVIRAWPKVVKLLHLKITDPLLQRRGT